MGGVGKGKRIDGYRIGKIGIPDREPEGFEYAGNRTRFGISANV